MGRSSAAENGDKFEGHYANDKREGPGVFFFYSKGQRYDGEWVDDRPKCGEISALAKLPSALPVVCVDHDNGLALRRHQPVCG